MSDPAPKVCATCGGPLDFLEESNEPEGRYVHAREEFGQRTHVVLPVEPSEISEIANHCDFCFASGTISWSVVTNPFKTEAVVTDEDGRAESFVQNYSSIWATCDECANLIRRRRPRWYHECSLSTRGGRSSLQDPRRACSKQASSNSMPWWKSTS